MKRSFSLFICGSILLAIFGCNTIGGIGKDMSAVGNWIVKGSQNVKESVTKSEYVDK